jgi:adenylate cyclase
MLVIAPWWSLWYLHQRCSPSAGEIAMHAPWTLLIYDNQALTHEIEVPGPAELGRQAKVDEAVHACLAAGDSWRVVIADKDANTVPRHFLRVEPQEDGSFQLTNLARTSLPLGDGRQLAGGASALVDASVLIPAGNTRLRLRAAVPPALLQGLSEASVPPGQSKFEPPPFDTATRAPAGRVATRGSAPSAAATAGVQVGALLRWLRSTLDVLQSAATSNDFFSGAARALVDMVRLDSGAVLVRQGDGWQLEVRQGTSQRPPSQHVLARVYQERRTFREMPDGTRAAAVVAAPILARDGSIVGVLYGDRRAANPISEVEAMLVEVLAGGVAAGLARLEEKEKALAAQVLFEQFFSPELARHLAEQPDLLRGRNVEVSVLFCDVRGFSRVSERLGPQATMEWMNDVLGELSGCVRRYQGVLVDYVGDELLAMWGAPEKQPDHAVRACRAALDMLACLPGLNARWQASTGATLGIGIGVNTGDASVGNSGSQHKFKYGPLGNTVNLGSRAQGATKHLKCQVLITGATAAKLDDTFRRRRLCQVKVQNIEKPVDLYELAPPDRTGWAEAAAEYEQALAELEGKQFGEAAARLAALRARQPDDGPALVLLSRAVSCMVEPNSFAAVWVLPSK